MLEPAEGFIHTESCRHTTFTWSDVTMFLMFLMFSGRKIYKICLRNEEITTHLFPERSPASHTVRMF